MIHVVLNVRIYRDGSIELYRAPNFDLICRVHHHHRLINRIRWHPIGSTEGKLTTHLFHQSLIAAFSDATRCNNWFATASEDATIRVYDFATLDGDVGDSIQTLQGHGQSVTSLCWSTHHLGMLLSGSSDGTAQVRVILICITPLLIPIPLVKIWNAETGQPLANCRGETHLTCHSLHKVF